MYAQFRKLKNRIIKKINQKFLPAEWNYILTRDGSPNDETPKTYIEWVVKKYIVWTGDGGERTACCTYGCIHETEGDDAVACSKGGWME